MSRTDPQFNLRLPVDLKAKLEAAAEASKRSTTAEILARLSATFEIDEMMAKRTMGEQSHTYLSTYLQLLEGREEVLDALDMTNPISMERLQQMIERAVASGVEAAMRK